MLPRLTSLGGIALGLLFPQRCVGCGQEGNLLCVSCQESLRRISPPFCSRCGKPQSGGLCATCLQETAAIDGIRAPFQFQGAIREAIHQFKYQNLHALAGTLAGLLNDYIVANPLPAEVLVPVPLHPKRLRERGYNQSALLARDLGERLGLPVNEGLTRPHYTLPQARTASVAERRTNIARAFACPDGRISQKKVLLIDDVATSGATLNACAAALKSGGATTVWGLVVAREI